MTISEPERLVTIKAGDPNPGRTDRSRFGKPNPADTEPRPPISAENIEATRAELAELRRRRTRPPAAQGGHEGVADRGDAIDGTGRIAR